MHHHINASMNKKIRLSAVFGIIAFIFLLANIALETLKGFVGPAT